MALIYSPTYRLLKYKYAASIRFLIMLVLILLEFLQSHITMIILVFHYLTPIPMHAPSWRHADFNAVYLSDFLFAFSHLYYTCTWFCNQIELALNFVDLCVYVFCIHYNLHNISIHCDCMKSPFITRSFMYSLCTLYWYYSKLAGKTRANSFNGDTHNMELPFFTHNVNHLDVPTHPQCNTIFYPCDSCTWFSVIDWNRLSDVLQRHNGRCASCFCGGSVRATVAWRGSHESPRVLQVSSCAPQQCFQSG